MENSPLELHELISLNQTNHNESAIDVPDSYFSFPVDEIKETKNRAKHKFDSVSLNLGCYVNNAFMSNECILENQLNHSKETCFNDLTIEESIDGTIRYRTISFEKKENEPLGITIKNDKNNVIIGRVIKGGLGLQFGLNEGDEMIKINQVDVKGRNINEISNALARTSGRVRFVVAIKNKETFSFRSTDSELNLRALFDYDPEEDQYIPCKELGIKFKKGNILHVVDQSDPNWYQATLDINGNCLAGLIPSAQFQIMRNNSLDLIEVNRKSRINIFCGKKKKKKIRDHRLSKNNSIYEKVSLAYPNKTIKRPIVLIGPTNLGIFELRKLLIQNDERLGIAVPHTTKRKELEEIDGYDYHFCSQKEFELQIKENLFIEYGKYNQDYYGLSIGSILAVVESSKICLLNLNPATIEKIRNDQISALIKPYFIFISASPDQFDNLQELKIIEESMEIQRNYGQYFDCTIVRTSLEETYARLLDEINSVESKPKWVPTAWLSSSFSHF